MTGISAEPEYRRSLCPRGRDIVVSVVGTFETCRDDRYSVAVGGRPDMTRTAQFGRE